MENDFIDSKENSKLQRNTTKLVRVYWFEILHRLTKKNGDDRERDVVPFHCPFQS